MYKQLKIFSIFMALVFSAIACDFTGQNNPEQQDQQNEEKLKTSVAATITAINISGLATQELIPPDSTLEPAADNTLQASTATATATATPTETLAPSPTSSPTPPPDDPVLSLGNPSFKDTFDSATNFTVYAAALSTTEIKDGQFFYTRHEVAPYADEWVFSWPKISDFYLEVTTIAPESCSGKDRFGLIFRAPSYSEGYLFMLACDGSYILNRYDGSTMLSLVDWSFDEAIEVGPGQVNRLGIKAEDNDLSLYINGIFLTTVEDDMFTEEGFIGFLIAAANTPDFTVVFDNLMYWE